MLVSREGYSYSPPYYSSCTLLKDNLDEIDGDSPCLFDTVVAILLYVDNVFFCSLNHEQAYKDYGTYYISFALLLALKLIYIEPKL